MLPDPPRPEGAAEPIHSPAVDGLGVIRDVGMSLPPLEAEPAVPVEDDLPLVVLDRDADLDALPAASPLSDKAQDYLRSQGITDASTWAAFRLDAITDADLARLLTSAQRRQLRPSGIWLPTFDPRDPATIVGLIRMTPAQHQHRFVTKPVGIAGDPALVDAKRIILTDNPLLAMRLHQRGVTGVAVVEDVAVLPPLIDWLRDRELIVVGTCVRNRATLIAALGQFGLPAQDLVLRADLDRSPVVSLAALGLGQPVPERPAVTPYLLRDLCAYAMGRITAGTATDALRALGITDPGFIAAFGIGYLPVTVRRALSADQQQALRGRIHPDAVVVPAYDDQGVIVDLLIVPASGKPPIRSLHDQPCGLIAPAVTTSYPAVVVVDTLRAAAEAYASGQHQVVLLRELSDAQANAPRLAANGVRRAVVHCQEEGSAIAATLQAAGITVADTLEEPHPVVVPTASATAIASADLVLIQHDTQAELATFRAGDLTYITEVPWDDQTLVSVTIQRGSHEHPDRIDLGSAAQRRRCASSAAMRTGAPEAVIAVHLALLDDAIRGLAERVATPPERAAPSTMTVAERTVALAQAQTPDLLDRIVADLEHLGWVGETSAKRFTILAALSRLTDDPVWVALTGAGSTGLDAIAAITPPEDAIHVSRLTDSAFYYADPSALRHKLLIIDDASRINPGVATALRVLKRRGALSASRVTSDLVRGQTRTTFVEVHGPIAVITATDAAVDPQLAAQVVEIAADESPAQVEAVLAARRRRCTVGMGGDRARIITRLQHLQRVLVAQPVIIPYAERITGFGTSASARRDHATALALLAAHALLYQHQRQILDGSVVATEADFAVVAALMNERQATQDAGLGRHAQRLLSAVWAAQLTSFTMEDLGRLLPDWTRYTFRAALDELVALDYLASPRSGRGMARTYHLHGNPAAGTGSAIRMALRAVGELATVGENEFANSTPQAAHG